MPEEDDELSWDSEYPSGQEGDLRVGFWLRDSWCFVPAEDRIAADAMFEDALHRHDLWEILGDDGRKGAVVWIAKCQGGSVWVRIKETAAATEWLDWEGW
jgi:hypothetical protein